MNQASSQSKGEPSSAWAAIPILVAVGLIASIVLCYDNSWAENDTVVLSSAARAVLEEGTITPSHDAYDHGFAYPTFVAILSMATGRSVRDIQVLILPWLTIATSLMAFAAFRAITGSGRTGAIAASLLLIQPDFLFVNQRGSHEKMTWTLVLALLFTLMTSLEGRRLQQVAPHVVTFYLCGFALLTTNAFFASSFTTIIVLSLLGSAIVARRFFRIQTSRRLLPRLTYVTLVLTALTYVVVFYLYSPAGNNLGNLGRAVDRIAALYLNVDTKIESRVESAAQVTSNAAVSQSSTFSSPYSAASLGWTSSFVFILLTLFTWILIVSALLAWLLLAVTFARRGVARSELPLFLIWAFTAAAGVQIAVSIASDFAGVLGSNLQLRLFPVFTVFAIPLVIATASRYEIPRRSRLLRYAAIAFGVFTPMAVAVAFPPATVVLIGLLPAIYVVLTWHQSVWARRIAVTAGTCAFIYFALAAVLKATNDPLVSNKWTFYTYAEARGVRWADSSLPKQFVWADFDERIGTASDMELPDAGGTEAYWTRSHSDSVRYHFMSDIIVDRSKRIQQVLPQTAGSDLIYDNGRVQITHRPAGTPYQP